MSLRLAHTHANVRWGKRSIEARGWVAQIEEKTAGLNERRRNVSPSMLLLRTGLQNWRRRNLSNQCSCFRGQVYGMGGEGMLACNLFWRQVLRLEGHRYPGIYRRQGLCSKSRARQRDIGSQARKKLSAPCRPRPPTVNVSPCSYNTMQEAG